MMVYSKFWIKGLQRQLCCSGLKCQSKEHENSGGALTTTQKKTYRRNSCVMRYHHNMSATSRILNWCYPHQLSVFLQLFKGYVNQKIKIQLSNHPHDA